MKAQINGIRMNFEVAGPERGPVVVLHHPLATNLTTWDELTAALTHKYRVIRMDARGHGVTEASPAPYAFETLAKDVVALMDHVGARKARFLGLSMGGMVGQYLGLLHPERFACLLLVSTSSRVPPEARALWDERIAAVRASGMKSQVQGALQRWVSPEALKSNKPLVARFTRMIEATPAEGYCGWGGAIRELDITGRLGEIRLPTRIIVGALDPSTPVAAAEAIHKAIPGSDLVVMPGVSHMLHGEAPAEFHKQVIPFLDRHTRD
ncbi:MAG TPA: alpha/beta fold hydrolase [Hyphomicrobiaceae bacterium]|nr:alpha/beta fold hydrolase [Hyphomicrobiaceae bacterium]